MRLKKIISKLFSYKRPNPQLNNLTSGKSFEEKYKDTGVFKYDDEGFSIQYEEFFKQIKWKDITEINAYKADLMTIDRIEMEIVYGNKSLMVSEDLPGWYQFVIKTKKVFSTIPHEWENEITQPPFATNWTNIYKKEPL